MRALVVVLAAAGIVAATPPPHHASNLLSPGATQGGVCHNEGSKALGNHCVRLSGASLDDFQRTTSQDFGHPSDWCICLHLYTCWGKGGGDTSACSAAALTDASHLGHIECKG